MQTLSTDLMTASKARKCSHCGATVTDEHADECPNCGESI